MNILIYLGHPAQYHFIKHTAKRLKTDGNNVRLLIKTKDILEALLKEDGWEYENIQTVFRKGTKLAILRASFERTRKVLKAARRFKADILVGTDSSVAQAAWLMRKPALTTLEDDVDVVYNLARMTYPFTTDILVPDVCRVGKWKDKKIGYAGYMKLAYLHPNRFTPDVSVLTKYGIEGKYILIRLAKLAAHHDTGIKGLNAKIVENIIDIAEAGNYRVFISSETEVEDRLKPYLIQIRHTDIHHLMAYSSLLISDSQSMSVEAAMLGVPNLRFSDFVGRISVLEELESKYHLTIGIRTDEPKRLIDETNAILSGSDSRESWQERRKKMLADKIDVTAFLTWFIENYPDSRRIMKANPNYQMKFK